MDVHCVKARAVVSAFAYDLVTRSAGFLGIGGGKAEAWRLIIIATKGHTDVTVCTSFHLGKD